MCNAVCLLDAPKDSVIDGGIIYKHICLLFCMVKVYYLPSLYLILLKSISIQVYFGGIEYTWLS